MMATEDEDEQSLPAKSKTMMATEDEDEQSLPAKSKTNINRGDSQAGGSD